MEYARYLTIIASLVGGVWIASRVYKAPKKMIFSHGQHHLGQPFIIDFLDPSFDKSVPCTGPNKGYKAIPGFGICGIELDEWIMVDALVTPKHSVIEFGARFGTTSCRLARATRNSGRVVAVEPDKEAQPYLIQTREANRCNFHAAYGIISDHKQYLLPGSSGYNTLTIDADKVPKAEQKAMVEVPSINFHDIEARIGAKFDAVLIDCEGCIEAVYKTGLLGQVRLVLIEQDGGSSLVHYGEWSKKLRALGFERVWLAHDTFAPQHASWSAQLLHSAWAKPGTLQLSWMSKAAQKRATSVRDFNLCFAYKQKKNYSDAWLHCATNDMGDEKFVNGG